MGNNSNDILGIIYEYVTTHKDTIRKEYKKVISNKNIFICKPEVLDIYEKYLEYEQSIMKDIIMLCKDESIDIDYKINIFQNIFKSYHKIKDIVEKFEQK